MKLRLLTLALTSFTFACADKGDSGTDSGGTEEEEEVPSFEVFWETSGVSIDTTQCSDCGFFGIAETNAECEASESGCWTGEDCAYGYTSQADGLVLGPYCHRIDASGMTTLEYGANAAEVQEGANTVFTDGTFAGKVTYYVEASDGDCFIGGADTSYYAELGCVEAVFEER